jgi:hypothetical protein
MADFAARMEQSLKAIGWLAAIIVALAAVAGGYQWMDDVGWVSHTLSIETYMAPDWLRGESRVCTAIQSLNNDRVFQMSAMFCPGEIRSVQGHNISVRFWGRISRPEILETGKERNSLWRCTRNEEDITCKALD